MNAITVPVPAGLQEWAEARVADGEYVDVADYLRDLMRRDRDRQRDIERVRALVEEGLASEIVDGEPEDILRGIVAGIDVDRD